MKFILILIFFGSACPVWGQHEGHRHDEGKDSSKPSITSPAADHSRHDQDTLLPQQNRKTSTPAHPHGEAGQDHEEHIMSHSFSLNLPMNRNGSGTGWLPDNSPVFGYMFHSGKWMYMLHGNAFLRYNKQDLLDKGNRGNSKFDAPNWFMLMGQRPISKKGLLRFSAMLSLDPVIAGGNGYPLLFQTGETYRGKLLIDRQHPHDLVSELSVGYAHALSRKSDVFVYVRYPLLS